MLHIGDPGLRVFSQLAIGYSVHAQYQGVWYRGHDNNTWGEWVKII